MTAHQIDGTCDPAFQSVADALAKNFETDDELGAAVAVAKDGELVVDLWGGHRDAERQLTWEQHTIVCMMSVGKAVSSLCIHMLADRGQVDLDAPVSQYWPAFAQNGKREIPVKWVLSHLSSVPVADAAPRGALYDWKAMTEAIAKQAPLWRPGTTPCYHTATQGFILGEILRNVTGQTLGDFIRNEISQPLALDYQIGLTPAEEARCATMIPSAGNILSKAQSDANSLLARGWAQLPVDEDFNSHQWRASQIPSANGHGNARAIAKLYGLLALGGAHDGVRLLSREAIDHAIKEQWKGRDIMSGLTFRLGMGFYLNCPPDRPMGPSAHAFGHSGAGGAQSFGDPDNRIGFAYSPNRMHSGIDIGPRAARLIEAVYASL